MNGARDAWIVANAINVAELAATALLLAWRYSAAVAAGAERGERRSLALMRRARRWLLLGLIGTSVFFAALGAALIGVAYFWTMRVPWFVVAGTGAFAIGWAIFAGAYWGYDHLQVLAIEAAREEARTGC